MVQDGLSAEELMAQAAIELPEREMMRRFDAGITRLSGGAAVPPPFSGVIIPDPIDTACTTDSVVVHESPDSSVLIVTCQSVHTVDNSAVATQYVSVHQ